MQRAVLTGSGVMLLVAAMAGCSFDARGVRFVASGEQR